MTDIIKPFLEWAGKEGYDTAHTYDTERSQWVVFNPMTDDLWKAYQAGAAPLKADAERWRYSVAIGGNQTMNWLDVYDDWDGDGDFTDQIDAARAKEQT